MKIENDQPSYSAGFIYNSKLICIYPTFYLPANILKHISKQLPIYCQLQSIQNYILTAGPLQNTIK